MIDLRSDTVTRPSQEMLKVMSNARVGDDVFGDDPTVNRLQCMAAEIFGMEAALYCPSGTMTNQIAIFLHAGPMKEVLMEENSHINLYEVGGVAFNSRASIKPIRGDNGILNLSDVRKAIGKPDIHLSEPAALSIENTANRGGGSCYQFSDLMAMKNFCVERKLKFHCDGARIFNALVKTGERAEDHGGIFDSISICLSKGLGAPVGSLLLGNSEFINRAKKVRKVLGGGMRQAGYLAAAGIYALENNIDRLEEDHYRAKIIEATLKKCPFVLKVLPVDTNIVIFELKNHWTVERFLEQLKSDDILAVPFGEQKIRMVTHLDFDDDQLERLVTTLEALQ